MPIHYEQDQASFREVVGIDEAESLFLWLQDHPQAGVDLALCTHLHAANLQLLAAVRVRVRAWPEDEALAAWFKTILGSDARSDSKGESYGQNNSNR